MELREKNVKMAIESSIEDDKTILTVNWQELFTLPYFYSDQPTILPPNYYQMMHVAHATINKCNNQ